ncbi:MAG: hypothetical protein PUB32_09155 [Clostridiales bacterium]|nr:hypothetical protein [Clostridiales bacterium]
MKKKALTTMLLVLAIVGSLTACGHIESVVPTDDNPTPKQTETVRQEQTSAPEGISKSTVKPSAQTAQPENTPTPAPTSESTPAPSEQPVDPDSTFLPSLSLYMGRSGTTRYSGNATYIQFGKLPYEIRDTLEAELLELLDRDRYQLELVNSWQDDFLFPETAYEYVYTGSNPDIELYQKDGEEYSYHVQLIFTCFPKAETFQVVLYYTEGFTLEDPGIYPSVDIPNGHSGSSGSSSASRDSNVAEFAKKDCFTCHGSGDCPDCNGYGYYKKDGIKHDCTRCSYGKCPTCKGSGKRD